MLVFATGLLDDLLGLTPRQKLLAQSAAGAGAFWAGIRLSNLGGLHLDPWWSLPLTILWIVACSNALNLIDGVGRRRSVRGQHHPSRRLAPAQRSPGPRHRAAGRRSARLPAL
jgi:hypothetical protein